MNIIKFYKKIVLIGVDPVGRARHLNGYFENQKSSPVSIAFRA